MLMELQAKAIMTFVSIIAAVSRRGGVVSGFGVSSSAAFWRRTSHRIGTSSMVRVTDSARLYSSKEDITTGISRAFPLNDTEGRNEFPILNGFNPNANFNNDTSSSSTSEATFMNKTSSAFDGGSILAIDPAEIKIVEEPEVKVDEAALALQQQNAASNELLLRQLPFVSMFRGSAKYIANHRNTVAV